MAAAGCKLHKCESTLRALKFTKQTDYTLTEAVEKYSIKTEKIREKVVVKGWQLCDDNIVNSSTEHSSTSAKSAHVWFHNIAAVRPKTRNSISKRG